MATKMANGNPTHIIEDSANGFWAVWPTGDASLDHVWYGQKMLKTKIGFKPAKQARIVLVRKEATRIVAKYAA